MIASDIGENCPEIHLHIWLNTCNTSFGVYWDKHNASLIWSQMPPGELSHWAPLEDHEMLFPCLVVPFCTGKTKQELCPCPQLLLTLQPATVVNRNTAVSLPWGLRSEVCRRVLPMILQWKPSDTLFQSQSSDFFPLLGPMPWWGAVVLSHERLHKKWW